MLLSSSLVVILQLKCDGVEIVEMVEEVIHVVVRAVVGQELPDADMMDVT